MIPLHSFLFYCGLYALAIAMPGPGVIAIVASALGSGFRSTIPATLGILAGDLILMTLSAFGLALVATAMGKFFMIVKFAGALYLMYLGYRYWTAKVSPDDTVVTTSARQGFVSYLAITLGNPKAIAFFVTLLPVAVDPHQLNAIGYLQLVATTLVLIPAIIMGYAAAASRMKHLVASVKARRRINKGAGAIMASAGLAIMVN